MSKRRKKARNTRGVPAWMVQGCLSSARKEDYSNHQLRGFYSGPMASPVKRIDPATGEVICENILETVADDILKGRVKDAKKPKAKKPKIRARDRAKKKVAPSTEIKNEFYKSWDWRTLRMKVLKERGRVCECCGASPSDKTVAGNKVRIVVDHIKPLSLFWNLRLDRSNLQVLCDECNQGKGNWDYTDFRSATAPIEWSHGDPLISEYRQIMGAAE